MEDHINLMSKIISTGYSIFESPIPIQNSTENEKETIRFSNIKKSIDILFSFKHVMLRNRNSDIILSVNQSIIVSKYIDFILSNGFIPYLLPSVWKCFRNNRNIIFIDDVSSIMKYEILKFNINSIFDLIEESTLNNIIMTRADMLLAGLCQLALFPIAKPGSNIAIKYSINELKYQQLINEQNTFKNMLNELIVTEKNVLIIRQIVFVLGNKNCQKHVNVGLMKIFNDLLITPRGMEIFLKIACDFCKENSQSFIERGLEQWCNLFQSYYNKSKSNYTKYFVHQIWKLLRSNNEFYQYEFRSVAVFCIYLVYLDNFNDCLTYYINPIEDIIKAIKIKTNESTSISQCIEDLHTMFYLFRNEIWALDPKLLTHIVTTIYKLYISTFSGIYYLKPKLEDLVYLILTHFSICKDHFKHIIFAQNEIKVNYNDNSGDIDIEFIEEKNQLNLTHQVDIVMELIDKRNDLKLIKTMFITLLDMHINISSDDYTLMEKMFIVKSILHLIQKDIVQKSISDEPDIVLNLINSILKKFSIEKNIDFQILTTTLMVLECIMQNTSVCHSQYNNIIEYLSIIYELFEDESLKDMVLKNINNIKQIRNSRTKSISNIRTIDHVLLECRDPLLPCRSHALIELKKMIESNDQSITMNKSAILIVIQENLKNSDSYLYLSAIFTLSTFCKFCPNDVLPIMCEEYCMPKDYNHSSETRLKIGEVLMKTIKLLNETIPLYRNRLLNTFMSGVRDNDALVRTSSLSNLADVCRLLRYNIGSILSEIVNCADYVLKFDSEIEPRRAAVLLLQMIIEGGDSELLEILGDSIQYIYRMLKFYYQQDKDSIIKLHSQVALERLNNIMKSLFLKKKIITSVLK